MYIIPVEGFGNPEFFLINLDWKSRHFGNVLLEIHKFSELKNYVSTGGVHLLSGINQSTVVV